MDSRMFNWATDAFNKEYVKEYTPGPDVVKVSYTVPVSEEQLAQAEAASLAIQRWTDATPEEREQWRQEAAAQRAQERSDAERRPLTLDALLDKLGWSHEYALHFVQPYCGCYDGYDGWDYCMHAEDEGVTP